MRKTNPNFLNGVPELLVLKLLSQREMYGYELVKTIQARSNELFTFGEGCIYPILHYLEETKLVSCESKAVEGRSRNYYQLTSRGRKRLDELAREWEQVALGVQTVLGGSHAGA